MSRKPNGRKPKSHMPGGPIRPGSALYRVLQMIATEIAKDMENSPAPSKMRRREAKR